VTAARLGAIGALIAGVVLMIVVLFGGEDEHRYRFLFENGGQLVDGNQVLVAGRPIGAVEEITLTDDAQAAVEVTVDEPLHEGTTATIRAASLSGVANRYISVAPGPNNAPVLEDGATLTGDRTTSPVDLDQLFNTLDEPTRQALKEVIQGSATIYTGAGPDANRTYRYFAPALSSTTRLLDEVTRDQRVFERFLLDTGAVAAAVAERSDDLSALTQNANEALAAIARRNAELDRTLVALPPFMRQANTTFVNLRAALDDLDVLVNASKPATENLPQFLRALRPVARRSVPVFGDLALAINRDGPANDLTDSLEDLPLLASRGARAARSGVRALRRSEDNVAFARAYSPDLVAWLTHFGQVAGYYDANGHYARVSPSAGNLFCFEGSDTCIPPGPPSDGNLEPIEEGDQFDDLDFQIFTRCPGGATQPAVDGSSPFLDLGNLTGLCNPTQVPPGP
jgi:phospholipid/cholesterol/gamma-HCH transport system substrate-binding protein